MSNGTEIIPNSTYILFFFLMVVVCIANRDTDNTVKASKFNKDVCINLVKNEEYKEMKKENDYISTDMNHKKLIVGVVIIHVCFMLIGASGIISTLKEKNIF